MGGKKIDEKLVSGMKRLKNIFFLIFSFTSASLYGDYNVEISGTIEYAPTGSLIDLHINQRYLNNTESVYRAAIEQDGSFYLGAELDLGQIVYLKYNNETLQLFLSPGDTLKVFAEAGRLSRSIKFEGKASANNVFLKDFYEAYPNETNPFKLTQYKYGIQNYSCDRHMENIMMTKSPENFKSWLQARQKTKFNFLNQRKADGKLSAPLIALLNSEIKYEKLYFQLMYGDVFKAKYGIKENYYDFLEDLSVDKARISGSFTRKFMMVYVNHMNMREEGTTNSVRSNFELAVKYLWGRPLAYVQSELIVMAMSSGHLNEVQDCYVVFSKTNPYLEFEEKVVDVYRNALKYTTGAEAPEFRLTGQDYGKVDLEDFSGKVLFLNFWASWCKPCIKKIEYLEQLEGTSIHKDFELVHVSLDESRVIWKQSMEKYNMRGGKHFIVEGEDRTSIMRDYEVQVLPASFLIDRNGRFVELPKPLGLDELRSAIMEL